MIYIEMLISIQHVLFIIMREIHRIFDASLGWISWMKLERFEGI